jgi:hypothetical protein
VTRKCLVVCTDTVIGPSCQREKKGVESAHLDSSQTPKAVGLDVLGSPEVGEGRV